MPEEPEIRAASSSTDRADFRVIKVPGTGKSGQPGGDLAALLELKNTFLRLAAHELRRPLGLMRGYLSMLGDGTYGGLSEPICEALGQIDSGSEEIEKLAESLANIARLEDQTEALQLEPYRLGELIQTAIEAVEPLAESKQIEIRTRLLSSNLELNIDADRLRIALVNLLENALKYSPDGSTIMVRTNRSTESSVLIVIADQGPGISPEEQESIFQPWRRGAEAGTPGLGLGLYLVYQIVQMHGGRLLVSSTPDVGSTFTVALPI
ncbi:MAG: sensor histidine kinase [Candidatus Dormibacteraceae bacterium]